MTLKIKIFICISIIYIIASATLEAQTYGDYTFYSPQNDTKAYLIDMSGTTYHSWTFLSTKKTGYSSYLLPGGKIVRTVANSGNSLSGGGITGAVQIVDWNNNILWDFIYSSTTYCLHHDICPMPNGNVLLISYEVKTATDAANAGCSQSISIQSEKIIEVKPTGTTTGIIVWEWHLWDHLCQNYNSSKNNYVTSIIENPQLINLNYKTNRDWWHMNGIDYNEELDQIVVSSHNMNEIYVIDHSTTTEEAASHQGGNSNKGGDLLYRWGNPAAYNATGTTNFNVVHDAHWAPADCPYPNFLVGFNNKGGAGNKSCIDIISPPYNGYNYSISLGSAYLPTNYFYRHTSNYSAQDLGNSQQLPNGNILVCVPGNPLYEINSSGTIVWTKSVNGNIPQAFRYTKCYVNNTIPAKPTITSDGKNLISSPSNSYQWYIGSEKISDATDQIFKPYKDGSYRVQVTDTNDCISSISFAFNFVTADIYSTYDNKTFRVYPNPSNGFIYINETSAKHKYFSLKLYNIQGKVLYKNENSDKIDLTRFENNVYILNIKADNININKRIILMK